MTVKISVMRMNQTCKQTIVEFEFNRESEGERENLRHAKLLSFLYMHHYTSLNQLNYLEVLLDQTV